MNDKLRHNIHSVWLRHVHTSFNRRKRFLRSPYACSTITLVPLSLLLNRFSDRLKFSFLEKGVSSHSESLNAESPIKWWYTGSSSPSQFSELSSWHKLLQVKTLESWALPGVTGYGCFGTHKSNLAELLVNREGGSRSRTVLRPPAQTRLKAGKHWSDNITLGEVTSIGGRMTFS